jgi:hypothetical protein
VSDCPGMPPSYDEDISREPEGDNAFAEAAALEAVVDALAPLTGPEAARVLRWAAERFTSGVPAGETP